jgi:hypothetical protein
MAALTVPAVDHTARVAAALVVTSATAVTVVGEATAALVEALVAGTHVGIATRDTTIIVSTPTMAAHMAVAVLVVDRTAQLAAA